jgi:hypothetical protein
MPAPVCTRLATSHAADCLDVLDDWLVASCRAAEQTTANSAPAPGQPAPIGQPSGNGGQANSAASPENPIDVSIVELIAAPERFRSRRVRLIGYVVLEFEGTAVYLHEEDYTRAIMRNALWLDVSRGGSPPLSQPAYAIVEARFEPDRHGHMDLFAGALSEISRISPWPGRQPSPQ